YVEHGVDDLDGVVGLGTGKAFRRVLEDPLRVGTTGRLLLDPARAVNRDAYDLLAARAEHLLALHRRRRVVDVHDRALDAVERVERALDQVLPGLRQHLHGHVGRNAPFVDQPPREIELDLRRGREADLDLLEADRDQAVEELELLLDGHRRDQRLVAVAQVDAAPVRRGLDHAVGPGPVLQHDRPIRLVLPVIERAPIERPRRPGFVGSGSSWARLVVGSAHRGSPFSNGGSSLADSFLCWTLYARLCAFSVLSWILLCAFRQFHANLFGRGAIALFSARRRLDVD